MNLMPSRHIIQVNSINNKNKNYIVWLCEWIWWNNQFLVQLTNVTSSDLIKILQDWINTSFLESREYNKELFDRTAFWSNISTT